MEKMIHSNCIHFGECGGCAYRDMPYAKQLDLKKNELTNFLFEANISIPDSFEVLASEQIDYYRNKMEFTFGVWDDELKLGMHEKNKFYKVLDINECYVQSENVSRILRIVRDWAKAKNIPAYHKKRRTGVLRHLVIRETKNLDAIMLNIMAVNKIVVDDLLEKLLKEVLSIKSVYTSVNTSRSDAAIAEETYHVYGDKTLVEKIGDYEYEIGPYTFFQVNMWQTKVLYDKVKDWIGEGGLLFDLYCGVGGFGIHLSSNFEKVIGIEVNPESINAAIYNAEKNNIKNISFIAGEVEKIWEPLETNTKLVSVIVDPPRSGLMKNVILTLNNLKADRIVYVSCNYKTMANDLRDLADNYVLEKFCAIDMFPHTRHIECVALLKLKY